MKAANQTKYGGLTGVDWGEISDSGWTDRQRRALSQLANENPTKVLWIAIGDEELDWKAGAILPSLTIPELQEFLWDEGQTRRVWLILPAVSLYK